MKNWFKANELKVYSYLAYGFFGAFVANGIMYMIEGI